MDGLVRKPIFGGGVNPTQIRSSASLLLPPLVGVGGRRRRPRRACRRGVVELIPRPKHRRTARDTQNGAARALLGAAPGQRGLWRR